MARLVDDRWGKSAVRVSKILRGEGEDGDGFVDVTVDVQLRGETAAYVEGDNANVVATDTMKNTVYALAQDHLTEDLESFGRVLADRFMTHGWVTSASVALRGRRWDRFDRQGFIGGNSERRTARVVLDDAGEWVTGGIDGLVVLKTAGSGFSGFPRDEFTTLPETDDRILATTIHAEWSYDRPPSDTTATWERVRSMLVEHFFGEWSASVQNQGWMMATAVLDAVDEIDEITFRLPNQHHLGFDLTKLGLEDHGVVFHPVDEPYGDIGFTVGR